MATKKQLIERWSIEPGKTIQDRILAFTRALEPGHGQSSATLFAMLDCLPYCDEVASGRDFRGSDFVGGRELSLADSDFSYSPDVGAMYNCDLSRAKFDSARGERNSFRGSVLRDVTFTKAKFLGTYFDGCDLRNASFDEASLRSCSFKDADLRGASFKGACLNKATFWGANLIGCDFRGADMQEAVLDGTIVDSTTDFRGADLINAYTADEYNKAGQLVSKGINLKACKLDVTTRLGNDPKIQAFEILNAALEVSADRRDAESMRVRQAVQRVLTDIQKEYFDDWYDRVISYLQPEELDAHSDIMDEAYRSLL